MRRVLVTRSTHQASELAEGLRSAGLEPVMIPALEIVEPSSFAELDAAIAGLGDFDWLVFTSANAVEVFVQRAGEALPTSPRIAVVGSGTARAAEGCGLRVDLVPERAVAESLVESLLPFVRRADGSAAHFLLVRAEQARALLPDALRAAGALVTIAPAYRSVVPEASIAAIRDVFQSSATYPDAIAFTSSSSVTNLLLMMGACGLALPAGIARVSIGPITSETLRDVGLPADAEAEEATIAALVDGVVKALAG